jgi:endonuclease/exonuclease/phosphatase (EEP) superfamily protein YafD
MNVGWRATFVYREPRVQDRHLMRSLLRRIKPMRNAPWIMIGDFNEVLWGFEHFSTHKRAKSQMAKFRDVLTHCNLHDVGFSGLPWTYDNKQ